MEVIEGNIVDIIARKIFPGEVHIQEGVIVAIKENSKRYNCYICPGFVDAHVHIESSMLTPENFSHLVISKGTLSVITDPHEIGNVLGVKGVKFMMENSRKAAIKIFFTIPSCVPATSFDSAGSKITWENIDELMREEKVVGLSEMMNVVGVLKEDPEVMQKLEIAKKRNLVIDGHAPALRGEDLDKYISAGITTDHESVALDEAIEKIEKGMKILLREGSAAKNYEALKSLIRLYPDEVMFCTDDSHPEDIIRRGEIDKIVKKAIEEGFDLFDVLKIACINPVKYYHLSTGILREGDKGDFIIFDNLKTFDVLSVYVDGIEKYNSLKKDFRMRGEDKMYKENLNHFKVQPIYTEDICKPVYKKITCIEIIKNEILTCKKEFVIENDFQNLESIVDMDILKIVYLNRYQTKKPQIAFIVGTGLKKGAFATTVAHDSHNLLAIGCTDQEICTAINALISVKGGVCVVEKEQIDILPLPIGGIMTEERGEEVAAKWEHLIDQLKERGCILDSPFMTLSFMSLIVIPELKIGEKGLFEYSKFEFIDT